MGMIIIKSFKNLKEIKNRDEYVKICEINYGNTFLDVIGINEHIERILPTEIINLNLENKFTDIRGLTQSGKVVLIEGHAGKLSRHHLERYYGYHRDSYCRFSKEIISIIACFSAEVNLKKAMVEQNICYFPIVVELKKIDGNKYLNRLREKFNNQVELDHKDCGILVHLPLFKLDVSPEEYIREICENIKEFKNIPEDERYVIIPAMYLNIAHYIEDEFEQEKLLEAINVLKYCENELDRQLRLAREDEARKVTERVTEKVTEELTEDFARNLLRTNQDEKYVHEITGLAMDKIKELKASL